MKNKHLLFLYCFVLSTWSFSAQAQSPIDLTPNSFNFDWVAENSPPLDYTTACLTGGDVIYSPSYPGAPINTGMPANMQIMSAVGNFDLAPYDMNNALRLTEINGSSGILSLQTPTSFSALYILAATINGTADVSLLVTFTDNTTELIGNNFTIADWFNGSNTAYTINRRITCGGTIYGGDGNPRLYSYGFNISPANQSKLVSSLTITRTAGSFSSNTMIVSLSGFPLAAVPTLGQWGLILLALLLLNLGLLAIFQSRYQLAGTGGYFQNLPATISIISADRKSLMRQYLLAFFFIVTLFTIAIIFFSYELMTFDLAGSLVAAGLLAFLMQTMESGKN